MGVFEAVVERNLPADRQHRIPLGGCGREPCHQIGDPRPGGRQANTHLARHSAHGLGHQSGVLLMPADHQFNRGIEQRIRDAVDLGPRDSEDMGHPMLLKQLHQNLGAVHSGGPSSTDSSW